MCRRKGFLPSISYPLVMHQIGIILPQKSWGPALRLLSVILAFPQKRGGLAMRLLFGSSWGGSHLCGDSVGLPRLEQSAFPCLAHWL